MKQQTFASLDYAHKKKQARRDPCMDSIRASLMTLKLKVEISHDYISKTRKL